MQQNMEWPHQKQRRSDTETEKARPCGHHTHVRHRLTRTHLTFAIHWVVTKTSQLRRSVRNAIARVVKDIGRIIWPFVRIKTRNVNDSEKHIESEKGHEDQRIERQTIFLCFLQRTAGGEILVPFPNPRRHETCELYDPQKSTC
jgi:hypothetical protein